MGCIYSIHLRHLDIHKDQIKTLRGHSVFFKGFPAVTGHLHLIPGLGQHHPCQLLIDQVVFRQKDTHGTFHLFPD